MKRILRTAALVCFAIASTLGIMANQDYEEDGEFVKSFRDPDRVDQRWIFVAGFGTAAACFALWSVYENRK